MFVYSCIPLASLKATIKFYIFLKLGPALPKALWGSSMVEVGDNLYIIGGWSNYGIHGDGSRGFRKEIYKFSCVSGLCSWTTLTQRLKVARNLHVAIPVDNIGPKIVCVNRRTRQRISLFD